jgi:phage terminase large subunit GpA-like protein
LDSSHWRSWVHERLSWPADQVGAWHLHEAITEDYCRQIVAEALVHGPNGKPVWIERSRENHALDCEAMAAAAAFMLNVQHIRPGSKRSEGGLKVKGAMPAAAPTAPLAEASRKERFADLAKKLNG